VIHRYEARVAWSGSTGSGYRSYSRDHVGIANGVDLPLSSDPTFRGNPQRANPEQLVLVAASSCQLLWLLHLCAEAGIDVVEYVDEPEAVMPDDGEATRITEIVLRPRISVAGAADDVRDRVVELCHRAHERCFVANSLVTEIRLEPEVLLAEVD
jgi:organic hydroperoxide reductase OsmC/OhrA